MRRSLWRESRFAVDGLFPMRWFGGDGWCFPMRVDELPNNLFMVGVSWFDVDHDQQVIAVPSQRSDFISPQLLC